MASLEGYVLERSPKTNVEYRMSINGSLYDGKISSIEGEGANTTYSFSDLQKVGQPAMSKEYEDFTLDNTPSSKVKVYKKEDSSIYSSLGGRTRRHKRRGKKAHRKVVRSKSRKLNRKTK